ncbi:MAG: AMP-binding protein, partial [Smithellaceae bacterium]|nr:AMP-binding protein [Smithellaceae bacterium]
MFEEKSMAAVFQNRVEKYGDKACVAYKKDGGAYVDISWSEMNKMVKDLCYYLISKGVGKGDKVALFSANRYEWWVSDLAILSAGAADAPIYATNSPEEARYVIDNSDSKMIIVDTKQHMNDIISVWGKLPNLEEIIVLDDVQTPADKKVITLKEAYKRGAAAANWDEMARRINAIDTKELATLIYTSGTTGNPKGV